MQFHKLLPFLLALPLFAAEVNSAINGVWRAQIEEMPAFLMKITDDGGNLSGAVLFYLIDTTPGKPKQATPGIPEPLLRLKFDGKTVDFVVIPGSGVSAGEPVNFRLRLVSKNEAVLIRNGDESNPFPVRRDD